MPAAPESPSPARRALAVAVGLFATWQLVYVPAANLIDFVPRRLGPPLEQVTDNCQRRGTFTSNEPLQRAADYTGDVLDFWSEVSGQEQGWALFAPGPPPYAVAPAVEFRFADGTSDTVLSRYEPADKLNPRYRAPLLDNRPFNSESQFSYSVWFAPPEEVAKRYSPLEAVAALPEVYRGLPDTARKLRAPARAWLAWQLRTYRESHPGRPAPVGVILKHRFIPTPHPGEPRGWGPVVERPYVKWAPADDTYEAYDVLEQRFVPVGAGP